MTERDDRHGAAEEPEAGGSAARSPLFHTGTIDAGAIAAGTIDAGAVITSAIAPGSIAFARIADGAVEDPESGGSAARSPLRPKRKPASDKKQITPENKQIDAPENKGGIERK